jgi:hypothetical protein
MSLSFASNNSIYHNNFLDHNLRFDTIEEVYVGAWDDCYPSGGNYWSDYTGTDLYSGVYQNETGSDGIGDTPYVIDENNVDHYPLMHPWAPTQPVVTVTVDICPRTLNLRSESRWITARIELPEGYTAKDIGVSSIMLNNTVPAEIHLCKIKDCEGNGVQTLMVKFDKEAVIQYILSTVTAKKRFMTITLTIIGKLKDGTLFQGSDTIKITLYSHNHNHHHVFHPCHHNQHHRLSLTRTERTLLSSTREQDYRLHYTYPV